MTVRKIAVAGLVTLGIAAMSPGPVSAGSADPADLYKAYYLEHGAKDCAAAKPIYDALLDADLPADIEQVAKAGSDRCRDHLAAENFATLMPPDALGYVELRRPGRIVEQLAEMLGLAGEDMQAVLAKRPSTDADALYRIPQHFVISPAVFEALSSFGGAALAITDFDPHGGPPSGVLVVHHGDVARLTDQGHGIR